MGGDKTKDMIVTFCLTLAMCKYSSLKERALSFSSDMLEKWRSESDGWGTTANSFLEALFRTIACCLEDPQTAGKTGKLLAAVSKESDNRLADIVDGRMFHALLARTMAEGNLKLNANVSSYAQKLIDLIYPGGQIQCGKMFSSVSGQAANASKEFILAMVAAVSARSQSCSNTLLPLDGKHLVNIVQGDLASVMSDLENKNFDHSKHVLGKFRDRRYKDVEPLGDEPDPYTYRTSEEEIVIKKVNKWNNAARQAQLSARFSSGYIDSLLLGTPLKRQVIAQPLTSEEFERRKTTAKERLVKDAEMERRMAKTGKDPSEKADSAKPGKEKKEKKGGKGQQSSGKAEAIKAEAEKKRLEKVEANKRANLDHVIKHAPKDLKTDNEALLKHLEELRVCAQQCINDSAPSIAIEAEMTALGHVLEAIKRDKKEDLLVKRHIKNAFVILQRILVTCRSNVTGEKADDLVEAAISLGFDDLAKAIEDIGKGDGEGGGDGKEKKDKKDKKVSPSYC